MIYGEHIRFRAVERTDIPAFLRWFNDPEVRQNLVLYLPMSQAGEELWFEDMLKRSADEQPLCIEVQQADGWQLIGNCSFVHVDWRVRSGEVGIVIGEKAYWNKGYGTEAMRLLLKHGFETLNLNRIMLRVYDTNPRAIHVYEKAGYKLEGTLRQAFYKDGRYIDVHVMGVLRSEWEQQKLTDKN